jgi:hypothetical protein
MPDPNYNFCLITHGTNIYIIGGKLESRVIRLDTTTDIFYDMPALSYSYYHHKCLLTSVAGEIGIMVCVDLFFHF